MSVKISVLCILFSLTAQARPVFDKPKKFLVFSYDNNKVLLKNKEGVFVISRKAYKDDHIKINEQILIHKSQVKKLKKYKN